MDYFIAHYYTALTLQIYCNIVIYTIRWFWKVCSRGHLLRRLGPRGARTLPELGSTVLGALALDLLSPEDRLFWFFSDLQPRFSSSESSSSSSLSLLEAEGQAASILSPSSSISSVSLITTLSRHVSYVWWCSQFILESIKTRALL